MAAPIATADSITRIGPEEAAGAVVVNASHGGVYAAYLAAKLGVAAAVFNDAGVGRDEAGIGGLDSIGALVIGALCFREGKEAFEKAKAGSFACTCGGSCKEGK